MNRVSLSALLVGFAFVLFAGPLTKVLLTDGSAGSRSSMNVVEWPEAMPELQERRTDYSQQMTGSLVEKDATSLRRFGSSDGVFSAATISKVLESYRGFFDRCYAKLLRTTRPRPGKVEMAFTILASGKIDHVNVLSSSLKNDALHRCLGTVLERVRFSDDDQRKPLQVQYPIFFE